MEILAEKTCCQDCSAQVVCRCLNITADMVIDTVTAHNVRSLKELRVLTGAGDGCTCCHRRLQDLIDQFSPSSPEPIMLCK
jgi:bacterioferritin-associated ferredoxin